MSTTDDTRQRSVAEILGWRPTSSPEMTPSEVNDWLAGQGYGEWLGPTPDDMLAWLRGQGYDVTMKALRFQDDVPTIWVESLTYKYAQTAPTLHAALEAAVRSVADREPCETCGGDDETCGDYATCFDCDRRAHIFGEGT